MVLSQPNYREKISTIIMIQQDLDSYLEKNKRLITSGNGKRILRNVYENTKDIDRKIFYDFLGEVLRENPALQEGKKYFKFLKAYDEIITKLIRSKKTTILYVLELEKYFLEKYCLFENEEMISFFHGNIVFKKYYFGRRVFFTNLRIITLSHAIKLGGSTFIPWAGLIFNTIMAVSAKINKMQKSSVIKSAEGSEYINTVNFGLQFPLSHLTAITLNKAKRGKHKGKINSIKITSVTETDSFNLEILIFKKSHWNFDGIYKEIHELLQKFQE